MAHIIGSCIFGNTKLVDTLRFASVLVPTGLLSWAGTLDTDDPPSVPFSFLMAFPPRGSLLGLHYTTETRILSAYAFLALPLYPC